MREGKEEKAKKEEKGRKEGERGRRGEKVKQHRSLGCGAVLNPLRKKGERPEYFRLFRNDGKCAL